MPKKRWSTFLSFLIEVVHCMRILNTYVRNGHWLERMKKKTLKTDMNDWKVSFLYPQIVHDCTTALTTAHNTVATGIRIY